MRLAMTAVLVGLPALTLAAAPAWVRIVTPHFVISGNVDAGRLRVEIDAIRQP